jgi:hypothetical protein
MICCYCRQDKKLLIKAHIIPEGFFRRIREGQIPLKILTNKPGKYPKKSPIGVYDPNILCNECEKIFGGWDDYAQKLLADEPLHGKPIQYGTQSTGWEVSEYDYTRLKLFFISLLWRASVSKDAFYQKVNLGSFEEKAKDLIAQKNPGTSEEFGVLLAKFDHPLGSAILDPRPVKIPKDYCFKVNYYQFYLASYIAYIKVDNRKTPEQMSCLLLKEGQPLIILGRDFTKSKELPLIRNLVERSPIPNHPITAMES